MGSNAAARAGANFGGETGRGARNCTRGVSPKCGGGRGIPRAVLSCFLPLSPAGLKVKGCSPPHPSSLSPSVSLPLLKNLSLCERSACRDHLPSYKNKSCGETQHSSCSSQSSQPFPLIHACPRSRCVPGWESGGGTVCRVCVGGECASVCMSEEAAVGLS